MKKYNGKYVSKSIKKTSQLHTFNYISLDKVSIVIKCPPQSCDRFFKLHLFDYLYILRNIHLCDGYNSWPLFPRNIGDGCIFNFWTSLCPWSNCCMCVTFCFRNFKSLFCCCQFSCHNTVYLYIYIIYIVLWNNV